MSKGRSAASQPTVDAILFEEENDAGSHAPTTESVVLEEELPEDYDYDQTRRCFDRSKD